jgi:putative spermidine/putrescine transport system substrate-binding protein
VTTRDATSPEDLVDHVSTGKYDGVLTTSDQTRRLIEGGDVAPIDYALVPGRSDVFDDLKGRTYDTVQGTGYAVPQGRAANLEAFRTDFLPPDTDSWTPLWSPSLRGHISIYDDPIFIADAALYLRSIKPQLGITSPYALDETQFAAVRRLLVRERRRVGNFWTAATTARQIAAFAAGKVFVGIAWPHTVAQMKLEDTPLPAAGVKPVEGTTGWVDEWLISSHADHPNCMYLWLDYVVSPEANAKVVELASEAPATARACEFTLRPTDCGELHADDETWWQDVAIWRTPSSDCGDARGHQCMSYDEWRKAWDELRAPRGR